MQIRKRNKQIRRDFWADLECEHCGNVEENVSCYDDANFHENVIPNRVCKVCGKTAPADSVPQATKYASHEVV